MTNYTVPEPEGSTLLIGYQARRWTILSLLLPIPPLYLETNKWTELTNEIITC